MAKPDDSTPVVDVQEKSQKQDDTEEMLGYLNELSDEDRVNLLATLRDYDPKDHKMASDIASFSSWSVDYMSQLIPIMMRKSNLSSTKKAEQLKHSRRPSLSMSMVAKFLLISFNLAF